MESFQQLPPAFPDGVTASLVLREDGKEEIVVDVAVLKVQPGDVLVLSTPSILSQDTAQRLSAAVEQSFAGVKALILADGLKLDGVVRTSPLEGNGAADA